MTPLSEPSDRLRGEGVLGSHKQLAQTSAEMPSVGLTREPSGRPVRETVCITRSSPLPCQGVTDASEEPQRLQEENLHDQASGLELLYKRLERTSAELPSVGLAREPSDRPVRETVCIARSTPLPSQGVTSTSEKTDAPGYERSVTVRDAGLYRPGSSCCLRVTTKQV